MPGLNLTRLEQDFGSTQPNPKPFEVFSGTGARGSDTFFPKIMLKFVGKRDEILSICKKDVIGCC